MTREIDGKFYIDAKALRDLEIVSRTTGAPIPEDEPLFLLRARDKFALMALYEYRAVCEGGGCTPEHLAGIGRTLRLFERFASDQPERMKEPGTSWRQAKPDAKQEGAL